MHQRIQLLGSALIASALLSMLAAADPLAAQEVVLGSFQVPAQTNIFGAGHTAAIGGGVLPEAIALPPGSGRVLTFDVNAAALSCCGTAGPHGADGGNNLSTNVNSAGGISGMQHLSRNIFLVGVFLGDETPSDPAPARLVYYTPGETLSPPAGAISVSQDEYSASALQQSFFIGDGLAGATRQRFHVPDGATRLFLGFVDALNLGDPRLGTPSPADPCCYSDNTGTAEVTVSTECTTSGYPSSCTPDCVATIAEANDISQRAQAGETHFTRRDYLTLFKAVECRTGVPAYLLKTIAFSEGLGKYYEDLCPRQFLDPCRQSFTSNAWAYPELWGRYFGPSFPLLALDPQEQFLCPLNGSCNCQPRGIALPPGQRPAPPSVSGRVCRGGADPEPTSVVCEAPSPSHAGWAELWPAVVHVATNADDEFGHHTIGIGVMQTTFEKGDIVLPTADNRTTIVNACISPFSRPLYGLGVTPCNPDISPRCSVLVSIEPLPDLHLILKDPQFNILYAAEMILYKAEFAPGGAPRTDAGLVALKVSSPPYGSILAAGPSAPATPPDWTFQGAQYKAIHGCRTTRCIQNWIDSVLNHVPVPADEDCFFNSPCRSAARSCETAQAYRFATEEPSEEPDDN
jgi:hypothetical protein